MTKTVIVAILLGLSVFACVGQQVESTDSTEQKARCQNCAPGEGVTQAQVQSAIIGYAGTLGGTRDNESGLTCLSFACQISIDLGSVIINATCDRDSDDVDKITCISWTCTPEYPKCVAPFPTEPH